MGYQARVMNMTPACCFSVFIPDDADDDNCIPALLSYALFFPAEGRPISDLADAWCVII
jgi:hypothetical protein